MIKGDGEIKVTNLNEVDGYFRYPDLTDHCIYLAQVIHATLKQDMPDKDINMMIVFLHQNKGVFPRRRRDYFARLNNEEITMMQLAYRKIFELGPVE